MIPMMLKAIIVFFIINQIVIWWENSTGSIRCINCFLTHHYIYIYIFLLAVRDTTLDESLLLRKRPTSSGWLNDWKLCSNARLSVTEVLAPVSPCNCCSRGLIINWTYVLTVFRLCVSLTLTDLKFESFASWHTIPYSL